MKFFAIALGVAAASAVMLSRKKSAARKDTAEPAPLEQIPLEQELKARMREFLERDRFCLMFQPMVDFQGGGVSNGEMLSRLNHPEQGLIFPKTFLPVIDELELYPRFDRYVFRKSCVWLSRSLAEGEQIGCISCNFSRKTLSQPGLAGELSRIADRYGVPHEKMAIEITSQEKETDFPRMLENLKALKAAGFRVFLDDYGRDDPSGTLLAQYPADGIKLDRMLLRNAGTEAGNAAFRTLVDAAKRLGMDVICEGIETEEQHRLAREAGCRYGQGYLFAKPMDTDQVFEMMYRSRIDEVED